MAVNNPYNKYKTNAVFTATPEELILMLYDGAVKFCNQAKTAIETKDYMKANELIQKSKAIIRELQCSLKKDYEISEQFNALYEYIFKRLTEANIYKDNEILEEALKLIRQMRDTWKEAMKIAKSDKKVK